MTANHDWALLGTVCGDERTHPALSKPFPLEIDGAVATCATDGKVLILVRSDLGYTTREQAPTANVPKLVSDARAGILHPVSIDALRQFTSVEPPDAVCPDCQGRTKIPCGECGGRGIAECVCHCGDSHLGDCEGCDGTGNRECRCVGGGGPADPVRIFGDVIDCRVLRRALRPLPDGPVNWHPAIEEGKGALIDGGDWLCLIMPLSTRGRTWDVRAEFMNAAHVAA